MDEFSTIDMKLRNFIELPLVSVVMPAFNSALYIVEALTSAVNQDYPAIEVIVVDDGSTDATPDIVKRFGPPVRLLIQANQGAAAARNLGITNARGKYIAFLDADDVWWRGKLRTQIEALAGTVHGMAYSRFICWRADENNRFPAAASEFLRDDHPGRSAGELVTGFPYVELLLDCIVWTSTVIVEKSAIKKAGLFDVTLRKGQDYDLWLRLSREVSMLGMEKPMALYRIHGGSITTSVRPINYEYKILLNAIERWGVVGPDGRIASPKYTAERLARSSRHHGLAHLARGDPRIAAHSFSLSMRHSRVSLTLVFLWLTAVFKQGLSTLRLQLRSRPID